MNEAKYEPIEMLVGYGRIKASWVDGTAFWVSDYARRSDEEIEAIQFARRQTRLKQEFVRYKLLQPTVEIIQTGGAEKVEGNGPHASVVGGQALRVASLILPYVDPVLMRPIVELRRAGKTAESVHKEMVNKSLMDGGQAIYTTFGGAIPRK